jgi:LmbE family N-acetylglucosaminyl deacetylase
MTPSGSTFSRAVALALWATASTARAHTPEQPDAAALLRDLERLGRVGRVLYLAPHPDDENTRLLAWLVNVPKVRAAYLSLTRGEGGQNLIGAEQAPLLGLIRTQELLDARSIDHAEQLFGRERDFGYSKSPEEALAIWGHDEALADVVWAIRRWRPDVVITRFSPDDRDTHGHHIASAMLAREAYEKAGDPAAFPEQLAFVKPWRPVRVVWNRGLWGPTDPKDLVGFVGLETGVFDPLLGASMSEIAARSRSMHKSQGFGSTSRRGSALEYFKLLAGEPMQSSPLDGVELGWKRIPGSSGLERLLEKARVEFKPQDPAASIPTLLAARDALDKLGDAQVKADVRPALDRVVAGCAGLWADATAAAPSAVPGAELSIALEAVNRSSAAVTLKSVRLLGEEVAVGKPLAPNQPWTESRKPALPRDTAYTTPYWLAEEPTTGRWTVKDQRLVGLPEEPPAVVATLVFDVAGHELTLEREVTYAWTDPVAGERRRPLEVVPPVTLAPRDALLVFPDSRPQELRVEVRATVAAAAGTLEPEVPAGFTLAPQKLAFALEKPGAVQTLVFRVTPPGRLAQETASETGQLHLSAVLDGGARVSSSIARVEYPHIPMQTVVSAARVKLVRLNLARSVTRVGYIPGAGDEVPAALRRVGYEVTVLTDELLAEQPLDRFEAIVTGVRAFNTNPHLPDYHAKLMDYVAKGGTLVVQYNTANRISKLAGELGPFPLALGQDRVTDEDAHVKILKPEHRLLTTPNRLAAKDFDGWVQERGLYFAATWDARYQPLLSMHDPDEPAREGGLLVARFGRGAFVYTGLAFFRQLPAGVPGAYRLFANLLGREPEPHPGEGATDEDE